MASEITNHKCPACTGPLRFDGTISKLVCDYCGSAYTIKEIEALYPSADISENMDAVPGVNESDDEFSIDSVTEASAQYSLEWGSEAADLTAYNCPSCGAQLLCDSTTAATSCPYCGNNTVIEGQFSGRLKPDYIIPFKLSKDDAIKALTNYYVGKKLLPREFSSQNHIEEIKGVYVPFWLYNETVYADMRFHATRVNSVIRGNEQIISTDHFAVRRAGNVPFCNIPVDASHRMPDSHMDAIEPYNYSEMIPFSTAYLPGFLADTYDESAEQCEQRAKTRAVNTAVSLIQQSVSGYSSCTLSGQQVKTVNMGTHYAFLPVWMLSTKWHGKNYLFAMNGQTGKLIGDLPVSRKQYLKCFAAIALPLAAVLSYFLVWGGLL